MTDTDLPIESQEVEIPKLLIPGSLGLSFLAITFLFWLIYGHESSQNIDVSYLSPLNACLNSASACCLFAGWSAIRKRNWKSHRNFMLAALLCSALFLVSYIIYHAFHGDTPFQGQGFIRPIYFFILISHILLSVIALPLILITLGFSLTRRFQIHKKWARWAFPIWAYVSVTGVLVFLMLKNFGSA